MRFVDFFSGAGGLSLGLSEAGFTPVGLFDNSSDCIKTVIQNSHHLRLGANGAYLSDIREFDLNVINHTIDVLCAGPPCQPFSLAGKHLASADDRNYFEELSDTISRIHPKAFIIENVRGITRKGFSDYFKYVKLLLAYPELDRLKDENWTAHFQKLIRHQKSKSGVIPTYDVHEILLNAANFGVPQKRERVFLVGLRANLRLNFGPIQPSHSYEMLLKSQWVTGEYWETHKVPKTKRPSIDSRAKTLIERTDFSELFQSKLPWLTVRDAFVGMPKPGDSSSLNGHLVRLGARSYVGHTGSKMDMPSKTIKAGTHGVAGGENTIVEDNGKLRYFTVRECARLQTFPDEYEFVGSWSSAMKQIGNAVPVRLASVVATSLKYSLSGARNPQTTLF